MAETSQQARQGVDVVVASRAVLAEETLWDKARYDVPQTVHHVAGACERLARGDVGGFDPKKYLTLGSTVFGIISVLPLPHSMSLGLFGLGLQAVSSIGSGTDFRAIDYADPKPPPIPSSKAALQTLAVLLNGSVKGVDERITATEQAIDDTLSSAVSEIEFNRHVFDPLPEPICQVTPETLKHDPDRAKVIIDHMAWVADELDAIVIRIQDCLDFPDDVLNRFYRIGIGRTGPYPNLERLLYLLKLVVQELAAETHAARANFEAAMAALSQAEASAQALIQSAEDFRNADQSELDATPGVQSYFWGPMTRI